MDARRGNVKRGGDGACPVLGLVPGRAGACPLAVAVPVPVARSCRLDGARPQRPLRVSMAKGGASPLAKASLGEGERAGGLDSACPWPCLSRGDGLGACPLRSRSAGPDGACPIPAAVGSGACPVPVPDDACPVRKHCAKHDGACPVPNASRAERVPCRTRASHAPVPVLRKQACANMSEHSPTQTLCENRCGWCAVKVCGRCLVGPAVAPARREGTAARPVRGRCCSVAVRRRRLASRVPAQRESPANPMGCCRRCGR